MFVIVITHSLPKYGDLTAPYVIDINTTVVGLQYTLVYLSMDLGYIGLSIFTICSAYFLVDSKKLSREKIWMMVSDVFAISVIWMIVIIALGYNVSFHQMLNSLLPIISANNWYIGCYLVLYLLHPFLNIVIDNIDRKTHLYIVVITLGVYSFIASVRYGIYYNNELVQFVMLYFLIAYIKKYGEKRFESTARNVLRALVGFAVLIILLLLLQYVFTSLNMACSLYGFNPIILFIAINIFYMFKNVSFSNSFVNKLAGMTLLIYVIHENILFRENIKPVFWEYIYNTYGYDSLFLYVILVAIVLFGGSIVIAFIYECTIKKIVTRVWRWLDATLIKVENMIYGKEI